MITALESRGFSAAAEVADIGLRKSYEVESTVLWYVG